MMLFEYIFVNYLVFCEYYVRGKDGGRGGGGELNVFEIRIFIYVLDEL